MRVLKLFSGARLRGHVSRVFFGTAIPDLRESGVVDFVTTPRDICFTFLSAVEPVNAYLTISPQNGFGDV